MSVQAELFPADAFPPEQRPYTARELQLCAERELTIRRQVYPGKVARRRMSQATANHQIAMMKQIAQEYRLKADERPVRTTPIFDERGKHVGYRLDEEQGQ